MSFDFTQVDDADPLNKSISRLKQDAAFKLARDQVDSLDDTEDIFSDSPMTETKISFQTLLGAQHVFRFNKAYKCPKDPGRIVGAWIRGYQLGNTIRDFSNFNHRATLHGEPLLVGSSWDAGIYDESIGFKSTALRFNRPGSPEEGAENMVIPDHADLRTNNITTAGKGFSIFFRVKLYDLNPEGGISRTICQKRDDSTGTPNYANMLQVTDTGRIRFFARRAGVLVDKQTGSGVINTTDIFAGFVTYAVTSNIVHIYTWKEDGTPTPTVTDQSLSASGAGDNWGGTTDLGQYLFRRGQGQDGHVYGDFYDWALYRPFGSFSGIVSSTEAGYRSINKHSISNIGFGKIPFANHWSMREEPGPASFTNVSFTGTSFNTN